MKELANKCILIIDDDVHLSATLAMGLEAHDCQVICAPNAEIGLKMAHEHLPDLILSDIEMPGKDGSRLLKEMRKDAALSDRQFVLMTGKTDYANPRVAMDLGADDFLLKPFTLDALLACVAARLQRAERSRKLDEGAVAQLRVDLHTDLPQQFFNPLAVVLGLTELLQKDFASLSPVEIQQDLGDIHRAGRRLHRNLRNYILLLELETVESVRPSELVEPDQVIIALTDGANAAGKYHQREDDVVLELKTARLRLAPADLTVIVEELVDNALTYSKQASQVIVRARSVGNQLHISVNDAGRGMTAPQLEGLSVGFKNGDKSRKGLGLTLVHLLAKQMGGEFHIESETGKGTTSHLVLPVSSE